VNIGVVDALAIDGNRLRGTLRLGKSTRAGELAADIDAGIVSGVSLGYRILAHSEDEDGNVTATRWMPFEVSLVSIPADVSAGINRSATMPDPIKPNTPSREMQILDICDRARLDLTFARSLIDDAELDVEGARSAVIDKLAESDRARLPTAITFSNFDDDAVLAVRDTLALRMGARLKEPHPSAAQGDLARMSYREMGQLFERSAFGGRFGGHFGGQVRNVGSYFAQPASDLPGVTLDAANRLAAALMEEAERTDGWVDTNTASNLLPHHRVQSDVGAFKTVRENDQVEYTKVSDKSEANNLDTYGVRIALSRKMLINGEMENVGRLVRQATMAAFSTQHDTLYNSLVANPTLAEDSTALFHADHNNLLTTSSALSSTTLGTALKSMRGQKGLGGRFINARPRFLIVPAALETTARQLIASNTDPSASGTDVANPWKDFLEVIVEPRLDDDSETAWYLAAAPSQVETYEQLFLQGPAPQVDSTENDSGVLGTTWLVYFDHGVSPMDFRGLLKATGEA